MGNYTVDNQSFIYDSELLSVGTAGAQATYTVASNSAGAVGSWVKVGGYTDNMFAILDVSAVAGATGEEYIFAIDLSPTASPTAGDILRTISFSIGAKAKLFWSTGGHDLGVGRYQIPFIQMFNKDYDLPYARISLVSCTGTSGSVTLRGWFTAR